MTLKHSGSSSLGFIPAVIIATILVAACATLPPQSHGQQLPSRSRQRQLLPGLNKAERLQGSNQNASVAQDTLVPIFLPAVTYSSGGFAAGSTVVADVNGDGKGDLVVGNGCSNSDCSGDSSVGVLLGNGDGTFRTALTWDAGGPFVASLATADLNGDGKPDIVTVTNAGVSVLLGNGDGQFQPAVNYCCAGEAESIAIGDVNGDGKPDVIVAIWYSSVGVLLGNGDGTFQMPLIYDSGDGGSTFLAVADLNGDGKQDVVVANSCGNEHCSGGGSVGVLLGNGDGTFQAAITYGTAGDSPSSIAIADVSADRKPDIIALNWLSRSVGVLLGNGDGTFEPAAGYSLGESVSSFVTVADLNRDKKPDLVAADFCDVQPGCTVGAVSVLLGNGDGTFQPAVMETSGGTLTYSLAVSDLNRDGRPDVAATTGGGWWPAQEGFVAIMLHVGDIPTTTSVASSLNPSVYGQNVTLSAAVKSSSGTPTGSAIFYDGLTQIGNAALENGSALLSVSGLPAGKDSIAAVYQGSLKFKSSASAALNEVVNPTTTTTSLRAFSDPAAPGQNVSYVARVSSQYGGAMTGTITFRDGGSTVATLNLIDNKATYKTSYPSIGVHSIAATYSGDSNNIGSTSSTLTEYILDLTSTSLTTSGSPSFVGQLVTFSATIKSIYGTIPNGELVTFYDGVTAVGTGRTASGIATFTSSSLRAKTHIIQAVYAGDDVFAKSSGRVVQVVNKYGPTTSIASNRNPSTYGQPIIFTAAVSSSGPLPPTGTVQFTSSGDLLGSATLNSSGIATLTKSNLNAAPYLVIATYKGDSNNLGGASPVLNESVLQTTTAAKISSSLNPSAQGQAVTFTATVTSPTVTPTGPVTFKAGTTVLGTVQLRGGKASYTTTALSAGSMVIQVTFVGNSNIKGSSAGISQVVKP